MVGLERSLSLWEVTLMSVGIILGAGIYVVIGEAAGLSGNGLWLSFVIAAFVATLTGLSYAELSSRFPKAGAEYVYVENSFGKRLAWLVGWLVIAGGVIGGATVAMGFARYFSALFNCSGYYPDNRGSGNRITHYFIYGYRNHWFSNNNFCWHTLFWFG
jgi:APA family basic amino acid/polyamine antiporter